MIPSGAFFPKILIQTCVVHQIRNALKYVASKYQKLFLSDLKRVYQAPGKQSAEVELDALDQKWRDQHRGGFSSTNTEGNQKQEGVHE